MKIIQYMKGDKEIYKQCMLKGVQERLPLDVEYEVLTEDPYNCELHNDDPRSPSEEIRVRLAIDNPDMVWLDTDIAIRTWPDMSQKGKPYFIHTGSRMGEFAFYVNGCCDFFKSLLEDFVQREQIKDNYWLLRAINRRKNEVFSIPSYHFIHCAFSSLHLHRGEWTHIGGDGYQINRENGEYTLKLTF